MWAHRNTSDHWNTAKETSEMSNGSLIIPKTTYDHMFISVYLCNPSGTSRRTTVVCVTVSFCWDNVTHDFSDPSDTVKKKTKLKWSRSHRRNSWRTGNIHRGLYFIFFFHSRLWRADPLQILAMLNRLSTSHAIIDVCNFSNAFLYIYGVVTPKKQAIRYAEHE